jgi:peptidoglycan/xylan/chitin deacetylase (PgdA/CDA1 family)
MGIKRAVVRTFLIGSGIAACRWRLLPRGIYCFNFHRIGNASECPFDRGVFSCNEEQFAAVVQQIKRRFSVLSESDFYDVITSGRTESDTFALLTFDDGYRDNYTAAFPVLNANGLPAIFFLPTKFISAEHRPWWDEVAWCVRHTKRRSIRLPGSEKPIDLSSRNAEDAIRRILRLMKATLQHSQDAFVDVVREETAAEPPEYGLAHQLFMSWDEAREMQHAGMAFGSHTHSHRILSSLTEIEQDYELRHSRVLLTEQLGIPPTSVSYPVGRRTAFTPVTVRLAKQNGYLLGFSFISGKTGSHSDLFELPRYAVDDVTDPWSLSLRLGFGEIAA